MPDTLDIPFSYYTACVIVCVLILESVNKFHKSWAIPALAIYATTIIWYFTEVFYTPERLVIFDSSILDQGFYQVIIFLVTFRLCLPSITNALTKRVYLKNLSETSHRFSLSPEQLLKIFLIIWLILLVYGISQLNWDVWQALFPRGGRWAPRLWSRGGVGQGFDFVTSALGYIYALICAMFGILIFFQKKLEPRIINFLVICISWPAFYLSGTRNSFLAVAMPAYFTYLIISKQKWAAKLIVSIISFAVINYLFLIVIALRNTGIDAYFEGDAVISEEIKHQGLNMFEELCFINTFYENGKLSLQYGMDYVAEALNIIPRFLLPDKPLIGYEYNLLRNPESGIQATISAGFVGRGVLNFGSWFGPIFVSLIMSVWSGFLARLWIQRESILRLSLFLVGLGITPNLGRDITLLVLWPIVFGYFIIMYLEKMERRSQSSRLNKPRKSSYL
ncbi:hypothetical protein H6F44_09180 [Pseudanabaena sp. FACHB-1277]|uniref:Oligosaccharide repeat unit polymerase n=1 Tax=Pseudanabaena cinerea FACHB-1277 TaxID=2949581 RepID=A0A926Z640_9CYAN|nr:hypothetical protein [Pseudanabaena cinerea]MBD2150288.1 hypothetical protein [Pseudanabaena cinerea FACHB-1277]